MSALQVGQKLWRVPNDTRRREVEVEVLSIGRKWAQISGGERIEIETLLVDGGPGFGSDARCWMTEGAWRAEQERRTAWSKLQQAVKDTWRPPEHLTTEAITEMLARVSAGGAS